MTTMATYPNVDQTIAGLKQGVNIMIPLRPVSVNPDAPPIVLRTDYSAELQLYYPARGRLKAAFALGTADESIILIPSAIELYFAALASLSLGKSRGMVPFDLYGTLYVQTATGGSVFSRDLHFSMEASF